MADEIETLKQAAVAFVGGVLVTAGLEGVGVTFILASLLTAIVLVWVVRLG